MRLLVAAALLAVCATARGQPIGYEDARHLLNRVGFGASHAEVLEYAPLDRLQAVERLLRESRRAATLEPPASVEEPFVARYKVRAMSAQERKALQRRQFVHGLELRSWWLREMLLTPSPITERMTLFWHNHFATSQRKVRSTRLMYRQNVLLRREALGNFATLLHAVSKDPAMLIYLDNAGSRRQAPNENFAREVMELFTLGEGRYGEADIKEAARAFTGWSIDRETGEFRYRARFHDHGDKTVLGRTGRFDAEAVLDLLLERPETAQLVVAKLWREFVSPMPDHARVRELARAFRETRYEVKPLMRALLLSDEFWATHNRGSLIKSPLDLVVGTLRTLEQRPPDLRGAVIACTALGQSPFLPPNVKGWPGGPAWISSATLLGRKQWLGRHFGAADAMAMRSKAALAAGDLDRLLLAMPPLHAAAAADPAERMRQLVSDPVYQLR